MNEKAIPTVEEAAPCPAKAPKSAAAGVTSTICFVLVFLLSILDLNLAADLAPREQGTVVHVVMVFLSGFGLLIGLMALNNRRCKKGYAAVGTILNLLGLVWAVLPFLPEYLKPR
jgi:hypothetical protein